MSDDDDDLPDVGPALTRREYVIHECEHLVKFRLWPDEIARQLDYTDADSLQAALHKWRRHDLAEYFERWRYDGNVPQKIVQQVLHRKAKQREEAA